MRVKHLFIVALAFIAFNACQTSIQLGGQDDAFWNSKTASVSRQQLVQNNPPSINENRQSFSDNNSNFTPIEQYDNYDPNRADNAYNEWNNRRNFNNNSQNNNNNNVIVQEQEDEREARRFGSQRNFYYDDPYFNSLSNNWGWTSFYNPMVRPGFYNWAPGFNVGLGWNSFNGWNTGFGFNSWGPGFGMGMGMGWNNWGWNNWGWNRWGFYDPWYNPWSPWGWYDPFWGPQWGWGFNRWNNPWYGRNNFNNTGDAVTNRPLLRPRASEGPNTGGSTLPPRGRVGDMASPNSAQPAMPNPDNQRMRPNNNGIQQQHTTRPGGDLRMNERGEPVYVRPSNQRPVDNIYSRPQMQNPGEQPGMRSDRGMPDYSAPSRSGFERRQAEPPAMRREAPSQPRSAPMRGNESMSPRGGGFSPSGGGMPSGGGGGGGGAPRSRPR